MALGLLLLLCDLRRRLGIFRLRSQQWVMADDLSALAPVRDPQLRILEFDHDVADFLGARTAADLPAMAGPGLSYIVVFGSSGGGRREPLMVDGLTARILMLSDGSRSAAEIAGELERESNSSVEPDILKWIEHLFICGLIWLGDRPIDAGSKTSLNEFVSSCRIATVGAVHHGSGLCADH
jgi:hypothetical protein